LTVSVELVIVKRNAQTRALQGPDAAVPHLEPLLLKPRDGMEIGIASIPVIRKRTLQFITCAPA
jgi:hypothetical protein